MSLVVDASVVLSWVLPDESNEFALQVLDRLDDEEVILPAHGLIEIANALVVAERRARISANARSEATKFLAALPMRRDPNPSHADLATLVQLASTHRLSACDAAYLELAARLSLPLLTLDRELRRAAQQQGVAVDLE